VTSAVLAVDIGGTTLSAGLISRELEVWVADEVATPRSDAGCDPDLHEVAAIVDRMMSVARERSIGVQAIGLGFPEYTLADQLTSREVFAWDQQPADLLASAGYGVPIAVESDVRCAALAEAHVRGPDGTLLYVSWGTGISSTVVIDGRCLTGRRGEAIALGALGVPAVVEPGWSRSLEDFASGRGIEERYAAVREPDDSRLDCRAITALAAEHDAPALEVVLSAAAAVAHALYTCVALLDPDLVVLGGGVGCSNSLLPRAAIDSFGELAFRPDPPPVAPARLGTCAGLIGAALVAWQREGVVTVRGR
jgi:glucokinase